MPSPFPGMDPFLQSQSDWSSFHTAFIVDIQRELLSVLPDDFDARTNAHVSIVYPEKRKSGQSRTAFREPDVAVFATARNAPLSSLGGVAVLERGLNTASVNSIPQTVVEPEIVIAQPVRQYFVEIIDLRGAEQVIAVIELLSPTNKDGRSGSEQYRRKQNQLLSSNVHLLEIDLVRGGDYVLVVPREEVLAFGEYEYLATLSVADFPEEYRFWRIGLRDPLPAFRLPLTQDVEPVILDLQAAFNRCYDASHLGRRIDYAKEPVPPVRTEDGAWMDSLLRSAGLRP